MGGARPPASSRSQVLRGVIAGLVVALPLIGWLTWPWGVREVSVGRLRITPPAPGTCVGLVEATVVNGTLEPVRVEAPNVWEDGTGDGAMDSGYAGGPLDTVFVNFGRTEPGFTLAPGGARVLRLSMLRAGAAPAKGISVRFRVWTPRAWQDGHEVVTDPIALDVSRWQAPLPLTAAALDGALAAGHGLRVVFSETAMPGGGSRSLDVREDGLLLGLGYGDLGGGQHTSFRRGTLDGARRAALLESLRTAPLADFSADPKYRAWEDGHPVRLLVVAGPVAFVGGSQEEDFVDSGLGPLLDHLRGLFLSLPVVRSEE